jgi:ATP-dependent DNA helicase DinG
VSDTGEAALNAFFAAGGPLENCLQGFAPRPEQLEMAVAVSQAFSSGHNLVVEAGTGTGKTLAYLVPALLSGRRIIISTGTRTLQDQLFHRDLPMIGEAIGRPADIQMLKGRSNYLCLHRLDRLRDGMNEEVPRAVREGLFKIQTWVDRTHTGDIAEVPDVPEDSPIWSRVTSTVDNCVGSGCRWFDDCHVVAARKAARDAELVVVNHHLLIADLTMKEEGFGDLLPGVDAVVVDEAHHFPEVAQSFFSVSLGSGRINELVRDLKAEAVNSGLLDASLDNALADVKRSVNDAQLTLPRTESNVEWLEAGEKFPAAFGVIGESLRGLRDELTENRQENSGLKRCRERCTTLISALEQIIDAREKSGLRWVRLGQRSFTANVTPLDASEEIHNLLDSQSSHWVFTSATLAVKDDFRYFTARIGMTDVTTLQIPSPFPFPEIARLYLPTGLPEPSAPNYTACAVEAMMAAVRASRGRAFLLFTSHRALRQAADILESTVDFSYPLLVQGTAPRSRLLEQFASSGNSVLLGTATFWEGVDIRGPELVLVAIDRLPFASPGDPMLAAKLKSIRSNGGNPFREFQLPQAVLSLKQGVGRLIRDHQDYGVVMICDPRVTQKSYGRTFLDSLPPMQVIPHLEQVQEFYSEWDADLNG